MNRRKTAISITIEQDLLDRLDKTLPRTTARSRSELIEILLKQTLPQYEEGAVWKMAKAPTSTELFRFLQELEKRVDKLEKEASK